MVHKINELPLKSTGTEIEIRFIWQKYVSFSIGNKIYKVVKPSKRNSVELVENRKYIATKIPHGKKFAMVIKNKEIPKRVTQTKKGRSLAEIKNDRKEELEEFFKEFIEEIIDENT